MAELKSLIVNGVTRLNNTGYAKQWYAEGVHHTAVDSNNYVVLAGGGYVALSGLSSSHSHSQYVLKAGDTMIGPLYINTDHDVGLNQNGSLIIGNKAGHNIAIDDNEIMARNNGAASTLNLNVEGGNIVTPDILPRYDLTSGLGDYAHRWANIYGNVLRLQGTSSHPSASAGARIEFTHDSGSTDRLQPVYVSYTPNDSYRAPAGLKVLGGTSATPAWFEVEGSIYGKGFIKENSSDSYVLLGGGGHAALSSLTSYHNHIVLSNYYSSRQASMNVSFGDGGLRQFKATSTTTTGKPSFNAHIIHLAWDTTDGYDAQLAIGTYSQGMQYRGQNAGTWGSWKTVLDSSNSSVSKSGETLTVKINNNTQSLANTWRSITNTYDTSSASSSISLSQAGAYNMLNLLTKGPGRWSWGGNGNYAYCLVAEIDTNASYLNYPIVFEFNGRSLDMTKVSILYINQSAAEPIVSAFYTDNARTFYLYKADTNKWELYANTADSVWSILYLTRVVGATANRVTIKMTGVASLPEGCIQPSYGWYAKYATSADSATQLLNARNLKVNLASSSAQSFNGTADATSIGVSGTLPAANLPTMYWANQTISSSSSTTTTPTFGRTTVLNGVLNITGENNWGEGIRLHRVSGLSSIWYGAVNATGYDAGMWGITVDSNGMRFRGPASTTATTVNDYVNILHDGNVGIGTSSPSTKLHINGTTRASGFYHSGVMSDNYVITAGGGHVALSSLTSYHNHTFKLGNTTITTNGSQYKSITGPFAVATFASADSAFSIWRGGAEEGVKHWVDDKTYHIDYTNDEVENYIAFRFINTDTESPHSPSLASDNTVYLAYDRSFYPSVTDKGSIGTSSYIWAYSYINRYRTANYEIAESTANRLGIAGHNQGAAKGINIADLLVSNLWADYTKVPTNGIYSKGVIKSGVAQGTAPFTVDSTTVVANLNVDYLDGYHHTKFVQLYSRSDIGTSPNFDNLKDVNGNQVNGFFEIRDTSETTGESGTKPFNGFAPALSILNSNALFQLAGTNDIGWWIRGKQAPNVTGSGVYWQRLVTNSGTWGISITGNAATATNTTNVYIGGASGDVNYPLLFTTATANGYSGIYADNQWRTAGITFNPSSNILRVPYVNDIKFKYATVDSSVYTTSFRAHVFGESTSTNSKLSVVRFYSPYPDEGYGHSTGIAFQGLDTQGMMVINYSSPGINFSGGNGANQTWWMKITGTNHASYDLSNFVTGGPYLPLAGGTMTGTIKRTYSASNQTPLIWMDGADYDNYIWQISNGTTTNQYYGFGLKYIGSGSGVDNRLRLYADNRGGTDVIALSINQSGQVGIGTDSSTSYRLDINGTTRASGFYHSGVMSDNYVITAGGSYKKWNASNEASTIVARDGNGFIYASYYNSAISDENLAAIGSVYVRNTSDDWIRRVSLSKFKALTYPTSIEDWQSNVGNTRSITVNGNKDTYYPVKINATLSKTSKNYIVVWKNLGSTTAAYSSGNHSSGTSSCWYIFEGRSSYWDGNGGYWLTYMKSEPYAKLIVHAAGGSNGEQHFFVWLRGGGTQYNISTTYPIDSSISIYYTDTNTTGDTTYPNNIGPRTTSTSDNNNGILRNTYIANIDGNAVTADTATKANKIYIYKAADDGTTSTQANGFNPTSFTADYRKMRAVKQKPTSPDPNTIYFVIG